jgi:RNA-directed DNA polymerase
MVPMNVREMQRRLSRRAEQEPAHRFGDLYNLLYDMTWLREAHRGVSQNAGKETAGCDGITMTLFDEHLEKNLAQLR